MARGMMTGCGFLSRICLVSMVTLAIISFNLSNHRLLRFDVNDDSKEKTLNDIQAEALEKLQSPSTHNHSSPRRQANQVLVAAYYRSGSSLNGKLLDEYPNSFYWFEPLLGLYNGYRRKRRAKRHPVLNGYDIDGITPDDNVLNLHDKALESISRILTCRLQGLPRDVLERNFLGHSSSDAIKTYRRCVRSSGLNKTSRIDECLDYLQSGCEQASTRAIKTIRLSLKLVSRLLKKHPDLKVIKLVRDPRGIIQSRNALVPYNAQSLKREIQILCAMMEQDQETYEQLVQIYPTRIIRVRFEDLAEEPLKVASNVYRFLEVNFPDNVRSWLETATSYEKDKGRALSLKRNATMVLRKWREKLSKSQILHIQEECAEIIRYFNYDPITFD